MPIDGHLHVAFTSHYIDILGFSDEDGGARLGLSSSDEDIISVKIK